MECASKIYKQVNTYKYYLLSIIYYLLSIIYYRMLLTHLISRIWEKLEEKIPTQFMLLVTHQLFVLFPPKTKNLREILSTATLS